MNLGCTLITDSSGLPSRLSVGSGPSLTLPTPASYTDGLMRTDDLLLFGTAIPLRLLPFRAGTPIHIGNVKCRGCHNNSNTSSVGTGRKSCEQLFDIDGCVLLNCSRCGFRCHSSKHIRQWQRFCAKVLSESEKMKGIRRFLIIQRLTQRNSGEWEDIRGKC